MPREKNNDELILKAATLYYTNGNTQDQIAKKFGFSRPTVVRLLKQARQKGFVEIKITRKLPHATHLETLIENEFASDNLLEVIVVENYDNDAKAAVAERAAQYLSQNLRQDHILGIGWSSTLMQIPDLLRKEKYAPERVVQLGGYVGGIATANAQDICLRLGLSFGIPVESLPAPVILKDPAVRDSLMQDPVIKNTLHWVEKCNIGLVGIGDVSTESTLVKAGYISADELDKVARQGAVGDVLSHYYDIEGKEIKTAWQEAMISIDMAQLRNIDNIIGVAAGADKANSMIGAIRCGILNRIIIDVELAEAMTRSIAR
ncbi:sugar-binding transcriptional regulator [Paremcibacter congregatus]|uniref:sugar-binding transcriptional regulator n=1 Tax=Paremcibacter congregatus TaxID=2043170 RepID=UPI0030EC3C1C|tara:strand:- start:2477 stop:3430 length:954 start_codon:yes stop_codon:yes gene_type:complete